MGPVRHNVPADAPPCSLLLLSLRGIGVKYIDGAVVSGSATSDRLLNPGTYKLDVVYAGGRGSSSDVLPVQIRGEAGDYAVVKAVISGNRWGPEFSVRRNARCPARPASGPSNSTP